MSSEQPMWTPKDISNTNLEKFRKKVNSKYSLELSNYDELYKWSVTNVADFWATFWDFADIIHSSSYHQVVDEQAVMSDVPEWFSGARLNFAENLLRHKDNHTALISIVEGEEWGRVTYEELHKQVAQLTAALRKSGLKKGDRVAAFMPNTISAVVAMLATASIGAIYSTTAPDFGAEAVLERFSQINPKFLITVNATKYKMKIHSCLEKVKKMSTELPELEKTVVLPFIKEADSNISDIPNAVLYDDFIAETVGDEVPPIEFEQLPFNHPLYVLYTSGTTGQPKCLTHSAGGALLQHLKEHILQGDLKREDVFFFYTTTGWMMFHWLISAIGVGATLILYEGSPFHPSPSILWDMADKYNFTIFGTSAKYLSALEAGNIKPIESHDLSSLRAIMSTGSPLKPESFDFVYQYVKNDVMLSSITGGTDIISCFAGSNPTRPVYRGEIQSRHLGMKVEAYDEFGQPVYGEKGELVCLAPFPSMPIYFWNDNENRDKYKASYFSKFPGVWAHGDYLEINPTTGGIIMHGRSDATLNPNGIRFGSAEIYNVVEKFSEVEDSIVVGQPMGEDERVVLFLKLKDPEMSKNEFDELTTKIKKEIRASLSPRHVPAIVTHISDIPYTLNGKKVEVAVKKILSGKEVHNRSAMANPSSLDLYIEAANTYLKLD
eukprot:gb/GECH01012552.1/.p1 GENE.gb/GECH01012552.1/~~gb/GECH01012552.1/.p1  ORF type:complete len:664 (+),score=148.12 gb/GECH01012552.1/:1-1992(+)